MRQEMEVGVVQKSWSLIADLAYAQVPSWYGASERDLKLSILTPKFAGEGERYPLLVWICGGAFQVMDRNVWLPQWTEFARRGCVVASVEYRTGNEAPFPGALTDIKAAIRYLRAHAERFAIDPNRVFAAGESAGGSLASLVGVYGRDRRFDVGAYPEESSEVQGVVDFYGVVDLLTRQADVDPGLHLAELTFLGADDEEQRRAASAWVQVKESTPPFLILHGDRDDLVPLAQSERLYEALREKGVRAEFYVFRGSGHGADEFYQESVLEKIRAFIHSVEVSE